MASGSSPVPLFFAVVELAPGETIALPAASGKSKTALFRTPPGLALRAGVGPNDDIIGCCEVALVPRAAKVAPTYRRRTFEQHHPRSE